MGEMTPEFAVRILRGAKVQPIPKIHGNPILYSYQNQKFYDLARNLAIAAIRENAELKEKIRELERILTELENHTSTKRTAFDRVEE